MKRKSKHINQISKKLNYTIRKRFAMQKNKIIKLFEDYTTITCEAKYKTAHE